MKIDESHLPGTTGDLSEEEKEKLLAKLQRRVAREEILLAANEQLLRNNSPRNHLTMRHIHQAVCIARRNRVIANEILVDAGFNPYQQ